MRKTRASGNVKVAKLKSITLYNVDQYQETEQTRSEMMENALIGLIDLENILRVKHDRKCSPLDFLNYKADFKRFDTLSLDVYIEIVSLHLSYCYM